jgi:hypothetical protein
MENTIGCHHRTEILESSEKWKINKNQNSPKDERKMQGQELKWFQRLSQFV